MTDEWTLAPGRVMSLSHDVWILTVGDYEDEEILGAYSTKALAVGQLPVDVVWRVDGAFENSGLDHMDDKYDSLWAYYNWEGGPTAKTYSVYKTGMDLNISEEKLKYPWKGD